MLKDKIEESISKKSTKELTAKPNGKPPPGNKTLDLDPYIWLYEIEDVYKTKEREETEILFIHD